MKHFVARHLESLKILDLYFKSKREAKQKNPTLVEWEEVR